MRGFHWQFFRRELRAGREQLFLFVCCVFMASMALSVVSGWRASVDKAMAEETKKSTGGDVVVYSREPFSEELEKAALAYPHILSTEMFTVTLAVKGERTLFSKLKAVQEGYPQYGDIPLRSGRDIHQALKQGVVVEERVLERLEIEVGDLLKVGDHTFSIADVSLSEPDRPLGMWGVSPRVFISWDDLDKTGLVRAESYLERRIHIKLDDPSLAGIVAEELTAVAVPDQERIETWENPPRRLERYVDNFFLFLDMMAVLAVALGGLGMRSTLSAWLESRTQTVAVTRILGADTRFVLTHYSLIVLASAAFGYLFGLLAAHLVLQSSGQYLSQMLPVQVAPTLSWSASLQSAALCLWIALGFASWPIYEASQIRPAKVLRAEPVSPSARARWGGIFVVLLCLLSLLFFLVQDAEKAIKLTLGLGLVATVSAVCSTWLVFRLKRLRPKSLALRTALGSWRAPEARTELIVFILSTCLVVLYTSLICERALRQSWIDAMPPDSPNLVFLDVQPHQMEEFEKSVDYPLDLFENMKVRVEEINGVALDRSEKRERRRDGRGRMDALPTLEIPENDQLVDGESLYGEVSEAVSVREDIAEALNLKLGDKITVGLQGIPLTAEVTSIRSSTRQGFKPSFEMLFPPALVEGAPRTIFGITKVPEPEVGALQTRLAKAFPSVVSMDLSVTIKLIAERLTQMVGVVAYFLYSGLVAGLLILVSATWSARHRKARETAYYKVLGAKSSFLNRVLWLEHLALGLTTGGLGLGLALAVSAGLCRWQLDVPFPFIPTELVVMFFLPTFLVAGLGWALSRKVLQTRPAPYLREG